MHSVHMSQQLLYSISCRIGNRSCYLFAWKSWQCTLLGVNVAGLNVVGLDVPGLSHLGTSPHPATVEMEDTRRAMFPHFANVFGKELDISTTTLACYNYTVTVTEVWHRHKRPKQWHTQGKITKVSLVVLDSASFRTPGWPSKILMMHHRHA